MGRLLLLVADKEVLADGRLLVEPHAVHVFDGVGRLVLDRLVGYAHFIELPADRLP